MSPTLDSKCYSRQLAKQTDSNTCGSALKENLWSWKLFGCVVLFLFCSNASKCLPRAASEINPQKRQFLADNLNCSAWLGSFLDFPHRFVRCLDPPCLRLTPSVLKQNNAKLIGQVAWQSWGYEKTRWNPCDETFIYMSPKVSFYLAGFPCTPFSTLGGRLCLSDVNARQLFACVRRAKCCRPKVPWICSRMQNIMQNIIAQIL